MTRICIIEPGRFLARIVNAERATLAVKLGRATGDPGLARKWGARDGNVDCWIVDDPEIGRFAVPATLAVEVPEQTP